VKLAKCIFIWTYSKSTILA